MRNKLDLFREFCVPLLVVSVIILRKKDKFFLQYLFPVYLPNTLMGLQRAFLTNIIDEKESKKKELLKIMSLNSYAYSLGWLITNYIVGILNEILILLLLSLTGMLNTEYLF